MNLLLQKAKETHYTNLITESTDQKALFKVVNYLSNKKQENALPQHMSAQDMANRFATVFYDKIVKIRSHLDHAVPSDLPSQQAQLEVDDTPVSPSMG